MKITWIGHSCFLIEKDNFKIVIDPYEPESVPGIKEVKETANMVLCSHEHHDHNYRQGITLTCDHNNPFSIKQIHTYHDDVQGAKRGTNIIHIIDDGKQKIAHMGDLGCMIDADMIEQLQNIDILLIPVGGFYTIDGNQAAKITKILQPRIVVPMHYRDDLVPFGFNVIDTVDTFIHNMNDVMTSNDSTFESNIVFKNDIQTLVLKPRNI